MGKKDLGEHAGIVDARQAGLTISEAADMLGFSHLTISISP